MYQYLKRIVANMDGRSKVNAQFEEFKSKVGMFGSDLDTCVLETKTLAQRWKSYGNEG